MKSFSRIATLVALASVAHAYTPHLYDVDNENGHITYWGDISITFNTYTANGAPCTINMGPQNNSWFYTGVHTFNDPNYYFFEFYHFASIACDSKGKDCAPYDDEADHKAFQWVHIPDPISDLNFYSSLRDSSYPNPPEVQRTVDFSKANIEKATLDGEKGYRVRLGGSSWLQNFTEIPSVFLDHRGEAEEVGWEQMDDTCYLGGQGLQSNLYTLDWNGYHDDFAVDYTFTNKKAKATLYYSYNGTQAIMTFEGSQKNFDRSKVFDENPDARLANLDSPVPVFEWVTGGLVESEAERPAGNGKVESKSEIPGPTGITTDMPSPTTSDSESSRTSGPNASPTEESDPTDTDSQSPSTSVPGSGSLSTMVSSVSLGLSAFAILALCLL